MHIADCFERSPKMRVITNEEIHALEQRLHDAINSKVEAEVRHEYTHVGPSIIRFGIRPTGRARSQQIMRYTSDIQAALCVRSIRMVFPVPGEPYVGVEIPNPHPTPVLLGDILERVEYQAARSVSKLIFALGQDVTGQIHFCDLAQAVHVLIGGSTGSGKSMFLHCLIASIISQATPDEVQFLMIDPVLGLSRFNGIPHLMRPVEAHMEGAVAILDQLYNEMIRRNLLFSQMELANLANYREKRTQKDTELVAIPAIVLIIDAFDGMMTVLEENDEARRKMKALMQWGLHAGIHCVLAVQHPSDERMPDFIKANTPTRIAFRTTNIEISMTLLGRKGAEQLHGYGDMLYHPPDAWESSRIQGAFIAETEIECLVDSLRQTGSSETHSPSRV